MNYSNWRQDLTEVMSDKDGNKKVTEKNIKNKIKINPMLGEAIQAMGGELIDMVEMMDPNKEKEQQDKEKPDPKEKKISQVKKQVLMKKMQAVRQGAGADIVAHYEPEGEQIEEKKGCAHTHEGEECPVHGKKECPDNMKEGKEIPANVKKIPKELDKAVALHKSQAKRLRDAGVSEAVYGGEPEKKKDSRMTVTAADKKANTPAYQKFKSGDKRYKAADHMKEGDGDPCWDSHKQVGMKKKGGKMVPNCVPKEGVLDAALEGDKKMGELHKKVDKDVKRMKDGKKFKESTEDSLKDRRMERGGLGGNVDYSRPPRNTNNEFGKKKPSGKSALDVVKAQIRAKHGKGAIMDTKKK